MQELENHRFIDEIFCTGILEKEKSFSKLSPVPNTIYEAPHLTSFFLPLRKRLLCIRF